MSELDCSIFPNTKLALSPGLRAGRTRLGPRAVFWARNKQPLTPEVRVAFALALPPISKPPPLPGWGGGASPPPASLRAGRTLGHPSPGRRIRRRDAGSPGRPGPLLCIQPTVSMAPPSSSAPFPARGPVGAVGWGTCAGTRRCPLVLPPGQPGLSGSPGGPPPARPHPDLRPAGPGAGGPGAAQPPARPAARGRGAAHAELLSRLARSEVAAETTASRPLPGLGGPERTPNPSPPATCPRPRRPGQDSQHPLPAPARSPGFQWSRAGGGGTLSRRSARERGARGGGAGAGRSPSCRSLRRASALLHFAKLSSWAGVAQRPPTPSWGEAGLAEREPGSVPIPSRWGWGCGRGSCPGRREGLR